VKPSSRKYAEWEQAIGQVQPGMTRAAVETILGDPARVVSPGEIEILSYCDEQLGDAVYGIRVAYREGRVAQCYLGFELCEPKAPPSRASRYFQLFLVVLIGAIAALLHGWFLARQ
jgi:hypothetical protein